MIFCTPLITNVVLVPSTLTTRRSAMLGEREILITSSCDVPTMRKMWSVPSRALTGGWGESVEPLGSLGAGVIEICRLYSKRVWPWVSVINARSQYCPGVIPAADIVDWTDVTVSDSLSATVPMRLVQLPLYGF